MINQRWLTLAVLVVTASVAGAFDSGDHHWGGSHRWHRSRDFSRDRRPSTPTPTPAPTPPPPPTSPGPGTGAIGSPTFVAGFGGPLDGITPDEAARFDAGRDAFEEVEAAADGLGPVFNGTSCVACHDIGATGGGSETLETRFGTTTRRGAFDPLAGLGGSLIQTDGIGAAGACIFVGEVVPPQATVSARRRTTPLFGLGLVDAVPDATFIALAHQQAKRHPETAGRPHMVTDVSTGLPAVGKFGWKAQVPNLLVFSGDAYVNEMGITTPLFPDENCPQGDCTLLDCDPVPGVDDDLEDVELFRDFMTFLAPPPRPRSTLGSRSFEQVGCAACHVPSLTTGPSAVAALNLRTLRPYSDFLLHDMGDLGDGIEQGEANGREMRTAPLWGLRLQTTFLHDGRATSISDAILAHDGQARRARERFKALSGDGKKKLLAFLAGL
jgi:CxxC motif-containing protein (DUF1111 family)